TAAIVNALLFATMHFKEPRARPATVPRKLSLLSLRAAASVLIVLLAANAAQTLIPLSLAGGWKLAAFVSGAMMGHSLFNIADDFVQSVLLSVQETGQTTSLRSSGPFLPHFFWREGALSVYFRSFLLRLQATNAPQIEEYGFRRRFHWGPFQASIYR